MMMMIGMMCAAELCVWDHPFFVVLYRAPYLLSVSMSVSLSVLSSTVCFFFCSTDTLISLGESHRSGRMPSSLILRHQLSSLLRED